MATKNIGFVVELKGSAQIRDVDGVIRIVNVGDKVHEGDILIVCRTSLFAYYVLCNCRDATGNVPHKGDQFACNRYHHYLGCFSSRS